MLNFEKQLKDKYGNKRLNSNDIEKIMELALENKLISRIHLPKIDMSGSNIEHILAYIRNQGRDIFYESNDVFQKEVDRKLNCSEYESKLEYDCEINKDNLIQAFLEYEEKTYVKNNLWISLAFCVLLWIIIMALGYICYTPHPF